MRECLRFLITPIADCAVTFLVLTAPESPLSPQLYLRPASINNHLHVPGSRTQLDVQCAICERTACSRVPYDTTD